MNSIVYTATIYHFKKDVYSLERGLSPEQKMAEKEEQEKGRKGKELPNNFSNVAQRTYIWNVNDWVVDKNDSA